MVQAVSKHHAGNLHFQFISHGEVRDAWALHRFKAGEQNIDNNFELLVTCPGTSNGEDGVEQIWLMCMYFVCEFFALVHVLFLDIDNRISQNFFVIAGMR